MRWMFQWSLVLVFATLAACSSEESKPPLSISLGIPKQPSSALIHIAVEKGYFDEQNLSVDAKYYASGKRALLDGLAQGEVEFLSTADAPYVFQVSTAMPDLAVLASIYTTDNLNRIVGRKDAGIQSLGDLAGKRVATQSNSAVHYFLHSVVEEQGIAHEQINFEFMRAEELPLALKEGSIDAFSMREPYVSQARDLLGESNTVILESPGTYVQSELLLARDATLREQPEAAKRLLRALVKAEAYAAENPEDSISIVARALETDESAIAENWAQFNFNVRLNQALLSQLERMTSWIKLEVDTEANAPNFLERINATPLAEVAPESISLVR